GSLVLTGFNFTATMEVRIGEVVVPTGFVNVENNNRISLFVPETAVSAPITIKTPAGLMTTITNFGMLPKIDALTPDRGRAGDAVSISGSGFFNVTSVKFNGVTAAFTNNSVNLITATVPAGVSPGLVQVITGEGTAVSAQTFLVFPTVTDFNPKNGPYGTTVVLEGIDFLGVTNITLSAVNVPFTVDSATRITATIPVAMSGNLRLYNPAGITQVSDVFTVRPQMQALRTEEGKLVMQWPVDAPIFRVQYTESLTPPVTWVDDNPTIHIIGNLRTVTNTPGVTGERFYRLIFEFPE
ncbi:MAG: IPT/TIG domain-containing protein, partial [Verrucomicrobiota bacterium]